jgi:hypothetical protein
MTAICKILNNWMQLLLVLILVCAMTGCGVVKIQSGSQHLPSVAPLPAPQLPDWIEQISPTGEAKTLAQIRIRFKEPLIPVARIDTPQQKSLLDKFAILPPIPGEFRFLTPRMVGFQAERALPKATRIRVTLKAGLADLNNHSLGEDLAWTFNTEPIKLTNLPDTDEPVDVSPTLEFTSNVELDLASLRDNVTLIPEDKLGGLSLQVSRQQGGESPEDRSAQEKFDRSLENWIYTIKPRTTLSQATRYSLEFSPGLRPREGNLASDKSFTSEVVTYAPLAFEQVEYYGQPDGWGAYGRFVQGSPGLKFNNGLVADSAEENISISPAPPKNVKLVRAYDDDNLVSINPWALKPATTYTITIGAELKDKFAQTLAKPATLTFDTGDLAPDIWAPSGFNIFPAGKNLQLNISTLNLPESEYQAAYQVVQPTDLVYVDSAYPSATETDLLPAPDRWSSFPARGKKNQTHQHVVPLRKELGGATGMLAYGVKAKTNRYQEDGKCYCRNLSLAVRRQVEISADSLCYCPNRHDRNRDC